MAADQVSIIATSLVTELLHGFLMGIGFAFAWRIAGP